MKSHLIQTFRDDEELQDFVNEAEQAGYALVTLHHDRELARFFIHMEKELLPELPPEPAPEPEPQWTEEDEHSLQELASRVNEYVKGYWDGLEPLVFGYSGYSEAVRREFVKRAPADGWQASWMPTTDANTWALTIQTWKG